jgi:hypothetical protein
MADMKFKVGDKVRIVNNVWERSIHDTGIGIGEVHTIVGIWKNYSRYPYLLDGYPYLGWCDSELELVNNDKIVITHDGKTTTAALYREDGTKETATANCAPEDKFDFHTGAKMALDRLTTKVTKSNEATVEGFKVGDRVNVGGLTGTIICISMGDLFGVQFDDEEFVGHRCLGIKLKAGKPSAKFNCWWVKPENVVGLVKKKKGSR